MYITFKNKKLEKLFNDGKTLNKYHGALRAKKIRIRMKEFKAAKCLQDFWPPKSPPGRCHELTKGKRYGQLSVDLDHPYRLIFMVNQSPVPKNKEGGLDWSKVTEIKILGVEDTHGK